jgi:TonB family protein
MQKWQSGKNLFAIFLIVSLLIHAISWQGTYLLSTFYSPKMPEVVEISFIEPKPAESLIPKNSNELPLDKMQIVEQSEKPINDEKPEDTKFLSAHNQVIKKQTVAAKTGDFRNRQEKDNSEGTGGKPKLQLADLKPDLDIGKMVERKHQQEQMLEKTMDADALKVAEEKTKAQRFLPNPNPGTGGSEASQTSDYLKDMDKGMETLLSTREFVYYTFYARIRRQLNQHWGGKVREKITKILQEGRSIASSEDKITKLQITLDRVGKLIKVQVVGDSGIRDLDQAAVEAFQEAAPFPNPPSGIVDPDGTIKIRWDFVVEA